jgi:transcriptional regulator with XRE-family HTH domain
MSRPDWPEQHAFLLFLDALKIGHDLIHDSALAAKAGFSHTTISNWRHGRQRPGVSALARLAEAFGEPQGRVLAAAGLVNADSPDPIDLLPAEVRQLIVVYTAAPQDRRERLLEQVRFLCDWARLAQSADKIGRAT